MEMVRKDGMEGRSGKSEGGGGRYLDNADRSQTQTRWVSIACFELDNDRQLFFTFYSQSHYTNDSIFQLSGQHWATFETQET